MVLVCDFEFLEMEKNKILPIILFAILLMSTVACSDSQRAEHGKNIVINELMASNRTGLLNEKGKPKDWIEIKNTSNDSINLKGFKLAITKIKTDTVPETDEVEEQEVTKTWEFPDVTIAGKECMVIFAEKKKEGKTRTALTTDFKLPKEGGTLQFIAPGGEVLNEVKFDKLKADQALARQPDGSFEPTYWQSPGFENNREGYEAAMLKIDEQRQSPLLIWEVMSRADESFNNWVELKNVSESDINLAEYSLAKKTGKDEPEWKLPDRVLHPGEFITIQLAGKNANPQNPLQADFKLGNAETIILSKEGKFVDGMCAKPTIPGSSIGRSKDKKGFFFFSTPTRNAENPTDGKPYIAEAPAFDQAPGVYSKKKQLTLRLKDTERPVHYTLDGSKPTVNSPLFKDSLLISENTVVRYFAEGDSATMRSKTATTTYLLDVDHEIPVVSIAVNNDDLYGYNTGIYANGPGYDSEWPHQGANYFKNWTKDAHVEFFDDKEGMSGFDVDCGLKIFGGFSRAEAKKSFRLKFKNKYGDSKVDYDFFGTGQPLELENLVLRAGAQDWNRCMLRDEFFTTLMKEHSPNILTQMYRPVALYVNGKYFGLYYFREKINKDFVARKLAIPNDSINIIVAKGYLEEGSLEPYRKLMNFVATHDMTVPENYEYMKNNVDFLGLIDYKLGEIYSGNTDVGNIRYVLPTTSESDKKWHFVFYDLDATWVGNKPEASHYISISPDTGNDAVTEHNKILYSLLPNPEFRQLFLERVAYHLENTFSTKNATTVFDRIVAQIRPEMQRNCERWPQLSYGTWEKNIEEFRKRFDDKHIVMLNQLREYLKVTPEENKKYFGKLGY